MFLLDYCPIPVMFRYMFLSSSYYVPIMSLVCPASFPILFQLFPIMFLSCSYDVPMMYLFSSDSIPSMFLVYS